MASGASARTVVGMVVGSRLAMTAEGLAIGVPLAAAGTRAMTTMLCGVNANDPATFAAVSVLLCAIAALACWVPALRASRGDPIMANDVKRAIPIRRSRPSRFSVSAG